MYFQTALKLNTRPKPTDNLQSALASDYLS